jgi:hypothetical protein
MNAATMGLLIREHTLPSCNEESIHLSTAFQTGITSSLINAKPQ